MSRKPAFTRFQHPTGEITFTSTRLGEPVAQIENDGPREDGNTKFRLFNSGVTLLSDKECDELLVFAGWDLDGSHQRALDENKYDENGGRKPKFTRKKPEPMIPSKAEVFEVGIVQGPPPAEEQK